MAHSRLAGLAPFERDALFRRFRRAGWQLLPRTGAATVAWFLAKNVVGNHQPFFAPLSAVIALNAPVGERGRNALRLLLGVFVGIVVGELAVTMVGRGYITLAITTFVAMAVARILGGAPIITAQAAVSGILTVTTGDEQFGINRLVDASIGGAVALVFSQVLFSPEPVRLLRAAEESAVKSMAEGLGLAASAADPPDDELAASAVSRLRDLRDSLSELARLRHAGPRVARHSAVWRSQIAPVVRETEDAGHLDLLGGSSLMFARVVAATPPAERPRLAASAREFGDILASLAGRLDERSVRQEAADRALKAVRYMGDADGDTATDAEAIGTVRMLAVDIMTFAGVDPDEARMAVRSGVGDFQIPPPARTPLLPFRSLWRFLFSVSLAIGKLGLGGARWFSSRQP